jgi:hypothetical protein
MIVLAKAKPNMRYENYLSISDLILEARLMEKKIIFYETHTKDKDWVVPVKEETVKDLFLRTNNIKGRPFLKSENKEFFSVLFRKKARYKDQFSKLASTHVNNFPQVIRRRKEKKENITVIRLKK